jgi:DNA-binding transcriptional ArsR family regulator
MDAVNEDHAKATVFRALSDPATLQLLLDALEAGQQEIQVGPRHEAEQRAMLLRLATLVDAGLMTRAREGSSGLDVYRLTDTAAVERLIVTARRLEAGRPPHR